MKTFRPVSTLIRGEMPAKDGAHINVQNPVSQKMLQITENISPGGNYFHCVLEFPASYLSLGTD
jgi:hypothetical protein